jgi:hypothetical protein
MTPSRSTPPPELVADGATAPTGGYATERVAPRTPGSLVPHIEKVRLLPLGVEGSLVNISTRGALILCCRKLGAGMAVHIVFEGSDVPPPVEGTIVRSLVSHFGQRGELWYHVGIDFDQPVHYEVPANAEPRADEGAEQPPEPAVLPKFINRW